MKKDLQGYYSTRRKVVWWSFSSCTSKLDSLEHEEYCGKSGARTMFHIECVSGVNIKNHSYYQNENEILLRPATQFRVISLLDLGHGLTQIQLREIFRTEPSTIESLRILDVSHLPVIVDTTPERLPLPPRAPDRQTVEHSVSDILL